MKTKTGKYCTIAADVKFGDGVVVHGHANLYGCSLGDHSRVGTFVEIQGDTLIGKRVRIQSHTFICSDVIIEDDVFIGHNVNFINDRHPTARKSADREWQSESIRIGKGASIGTGAIIFCGTNIGEGAVVGAGSVVLHDVKPHTVVAGNPARVLRRLSPQERWRGGERINAPAARKKTISASTSRKSKQNIKQPVGRENTLGPRKI